MSRPPSGDDEILVNAREAIAAAQTLEQLRQAQAVVLPLSYGLSLADTAQVIGVSPGWVCQLRRRFMRGQLVGTDDAPAAGGRKRQNMSPQEDWRKLAPDKRHPKSDPLAQDEWKKNSPKRSPPSAKTGRKAKP